MYIGMRFLRGIGLDLNYYNFITCHSSFPSSCLRSEYILYKLILISEGLLIGLVPLVVIAISFHRSSSFTSLIRGVPVRRCRVIFSYTVVLITVKRSLYRWSCDAVYRNDLQLVRLWSGTERSSASYYCGVNHTVLYITKSIIDHGRASACWPL